MPQFRTHTRFNLLLAYPFLLIFLIHFGTNNFSNLFCFSICFIYSTLFMSPDVDVANKIKFFSIRGILTIPFRLYSMFFHHRGISHHVIFGSITRIIWLCLFFILLFLIYDISFINKFSFIKFIKKNHEYIMYGCIGIFLSDILHLFLDKVFRRR